MSKLLLYQMMVGLQMACAPCQAGVSPLRMVMSHMSSGKLMYRLSLMRIVNIITHQVQYMTPISAQDTPREVRMHAKETPVVHWSATIMVITLLVLCPGAMAVLVQGILVCTLRL